MTKTTSRFRYRINPDVALTFQLRAPVQPVSVQPAEPRRPRGRPRQVRVDADSGEHDDMVDVDNNGYVEDVDMEMNKAENAEGCELSVASSLEQDEDDNVNSIDYYGENPADAKFGTGKGADDMDAVQDDQEDSLVLVCESEDDAVQHERPHVDLKKIPASCYMTPTLSLILRMSPLIPLIVKKNMLMLDSVLIPKIRGTSLWKQRSICSYARPFYPLLFPIPESSATMPKADFPIKGRRESSDRASLTTHGCTRHGGCH